MNIFIDYFIFIYSNLLYNDSLSCLAAKVYSRKVTDQNTVFCNKLLLLNNLVNRLYVVCPYVHVSMSVYVCECLFVCTCMSVCLSVSLSQCACMSIHVFCLSVYVYVCVCVNVCLSVSLSLCLSVHMYEYLSVCISV